MLTEKRTESLVIEEGTTAETLAAKQHLDDCQYQMDIVVPALNNSLR